MNNLEASSSNGKYFSVPPEKEEDTIDNVLSEELFQHVLSFLPPKDMESAAQVNKFWNRLVVDKARIDKFSFGMLFANAIIPKIPSKKETILKIINDRKMLNPTNLRKVKSTSKLLIQRVSNVLKGLSEEKLKDLENSIDEKFKPLLNVIRINRKIDLANRMGIEDQRRLSAFNGITKELIQYGNIDMAIEIAHQNYGNGSSFSDISKALLNAGDFDKAIEVTDHITSFYEQQQSLSNISKALLDAGDFDKAIKAANKSTDPNFISSFIRDVFNKLIQIGNFDKAEEVVNIMPLINKGSLLHEISIALTKRGDFEKAKEVANKIYAIDARNRALSEINRAADRALRDVIKT